MDVRYGFDIYGECARSYHFFLFICDLHLLELIFLSKLGDVRNNGDTYAYEVDIINLVNTLMS